MAQELDDFLGDPPGDDVPAAVTEPAVAATEADVVQKADPAEAAAKPGDKPADAAKPADPEPVEPDDVHGLKSALQATRRERADHKGRAERLEGEMAALKAQLEAAQKPPPPPPAPPAAPVAMPHPLEDPEGYAAHINRAIFNAQLNMSEAMLRSQHDGADVDAKMAVFKAAAEANPALRTELMKQINPYAWAYEHAKKLMAMEEIGGDPASYEAKIEAKIRAKLEAEYAAAAPAAAAAARVQIPQSLGTTRSASARNPAFLNVPDSFDEILATPRK